MKYTVIERPVNRLVVLVPADDDYDENHVNTCKSFFVNIFFLVAGTVLIADKIVRFIITVISLDEPNELIKL